jgi:serine phosphatase RsbU (regulator of sigma subunit)
MVTACPGIELVVKIGTDAVSQLAGQGSPADPRPELDLARRGHRAAAGQRAGRELPPEEVVRKLDRMAAGMPAAPFATCVYAVIDPPGQSAVLARAGHPPPVLTRADGTTEVLDVPDGLPLGLAAGAFRPGPVTLPPGATLALYADGLVESRTRPLEQGLAALRDALGAALARPDGSLDSACEAVTQSLRQRGEDDITLVLARIRVASRLRQCQRAMVRIAAAAGGRARRPGARAWPGHER